MSTSGTIGTTVIDTSKLLEHALRRAGFVAAQQTPEIVSTALENLFMLMLSLSNRGINLWCVDKYIQTLTAGIPTYVTPAGTIDILNAVYATPTEVVPDSFVGGVAQFPAAQVVVRVGLAFDAAGTFKIQSSTDGVTYADVTGTLDGNTTRTWYDIDSTSAKTYWKIVTTNAVTDHFFASTVREISMTQFNRDDYANQPNKNYQNAPVTNYYYEKTINPQLTCWPVPNNANDHLVIWRHRQVQDIGNLTNEIEIPVRWYEAIVWQLALRCSFEIPGADANRRQEVAAMAAQMLVEVENNETDHAPIRLAPSLSCYTR